MLVCCLLLAGGSLNPEAGCCRVPILVVSYFVCCVFRTRMSEFGHGSTRASLRCEPSVLPVSYSSISHPRLCDFHVRLAPTSTVLGCRHYGHVHDSSADAAPAPPAASVSSTPQPLPLSIPTSRRRVAHGAGRDPLGARSTLGHQCRRDDLPYGGGVGVRGHRSAAVLRGQPCDAGRGASSPTAWSIERSNLIFPPRPTWFEPHLETVARLNLAARPPAAYARSLALLAGGRGACSRDSNQGIIPRLGETTAEVGGASPTCGSVLRLEVLTLGHYPPPVAPAPPCAPGGRTPTSLPRWARTRRGSGSATSRRDQELVPPRATTPSAVPPWAPGVWRQPYRAHQSDAFLTPKREADGKPIGCG